MHSAGLADDWKDSYFQGCGYDFYPAQLSAEFTGMTFQSVAELVMLACLQDYFWNVLSSICYRICYTKWSLLLLGVENPSDLSGQSRYVEHKEWIVVLLFDTRYLKLYGLLQGVHQSFG